MKIMTAQRVPQMRPKKPRPSPPSATPWPMPRIFAACEGVKLTPARRRVLDILAEEGRPLGAYDMIEKIAAATGKHGRPRSRSTGRSTFCSRTAWSTGSPRAMPSWPAPMATDMRRTGGFSHLRGLRAR